MPILTGISMSRGTASEYDVLRADVAVRDLEPSLFAGRKRVEIVQTEFESAFGA